jgi:ribonuclease BN (tRNA processing enzyme)
LLIVECAHFPPEKLFATLPMGKIKRIVVNHLHPDLCNDERRILDAAKAAGRNDVIVAHDNLEIEI